MDLFDIGLNTKGVAGKRSKLTGNLLYDFDYGRDLTTPEDFYSLVNSYRGWAYICGGRNATTTAQTPLRLYATKERKTQKITTFQSKEVAPEVKKYLYKSPSLIQKASFRKAGDIVELVEHPLLDVLNNVNNFMNRFFLFEISQLYQELTGNSFWYVIKNKLGLPQEIWPVPPQNMKIIPDKKNFIKGYEYQKGYSGINFLYGGSSVDNIFYKEKDVVHFKMPSPSNYYYGTSPLIACFEEYLLGREMNRYENAVFKNNGRLDGAFETEQELGDYEFERLKNEIRTSFYGTKNAGKSPLLDNGVTFKPYSYSPRDMAYDKGRNKIKEMVCFKSDTLIETLNGNIKIIDIEVGDYVLTHKKRFKKVLTKFVNDFNGDIYKILTIDNKNVNVTGEHPVLINRNGEMYWEKVSNITTSDKMSFPLGGENFIYIDILNISVEKYIGKVYNLEVEDDNTYVTICGIFHNCNAFGQSLGLYDREANRNNADVAVNEFLRRAISPRLIRNEEKINEKICPLYDDNIFVAYDSPIMEDKDFRLKEIRTLLDVGYSTVDEQRKIDMLEPLNTETSDIPFKAVNMAPADLLAQSFADASQQDSQKMIDILTEIGEKSRERIEKYEIDGE